MTVMARTLGIPARMAVGFAPGERVQPPGAPPDSPTSQLWQVRLKNAHAWAELYFPGYGWQAFEATKSIRRRGPTGGRTVVSGGSGAPVRTAPALEGRARAISVRCQCRSHYRLQLAQAKSRPPPTSGGNLLVIVGLLPLVLLYRLLALAPARAVRCAS